MQRLIDQHPLRRGSHGDRGDGMCAMEMVAWLAGEPHSDEPACACPVLAAFTRACNDAMDDEVRERLLRPLVPLLVNTRGSAATERDRGLLVLDLLVSRLLPAWLCRHRRGGDARAFAGCAPVRGSADVRSALALVREIGHAPRAALWVLQHAADGMPPARFVTGAVQLAKELGDAAAWNAVAGAIERMVAVGASTTVPAKN